MTLLDRLANVTPRHSGQPRGLAALILRDIEQIEAARKQGYSWTQIGQAARSAWVASGELDRNKCFDLGACYNRLKKEAVLS